MSGAITFDDPELGGWVASGRFYDGVLRDARELTQDDRVVSRLEIAISVGFITLDGDEPESRAIAKLLGLAATQSLDSEGSATGDNNRRSLEELQQLSTEFLMRHQDQPPD